MSEEDRSAEIACIERASASYGGHEVLHDVSLKLRRKDVFALLGPNGAGKSTLVRLLTKTLTPRAGSVRASAAGIGLVPQDIALYPWLTPRENCLAFAGLDGLSRLDARTRVEKALSLTNCEAISDIPVARLSGGFQRRANIAVALMRAPMLLILDEPTAGLDAEAKRVIRDIILGLRENGAAILLVSHELDLIDAVADRIGVLVAGRFVANGPVADVMTGLFAQSQVVEILLRDDPGPEDVAVLRGRRAIPTSSPRAWMLSRKPSGGNVDGILSELSALGLELREVRFREPTIVDAYTVLTQDAAA